MARETLSSRLGFLMLSAACAIGLGNIWRFPYITGKYGGGIFVAIYLIFLLAVLPVLVMEFAIGRASKRSLGQSFYRLEPKGSHWHNFGWLTLVGSYSLMMFYTTVSGWMLLYCGATALGKLDSVDDLQSATFFSSMLASPQLQLLGMTLCIVLCFLVNALGLRNSVERVLKVMMFGLFILLGVLIVRVLMLPGSIDGLLYFLTPDFSRFLASNPLQLCMDAMSQAFFTLGIGIGTMTTIGSYYSKEKSLLGEAFWVAGLDTIVALLAGILIFPVCFAFHVNPNSGPGLIFITLPNVFASMPQGALWGTIFFLFMTFAAFSTVIAVFETIIAYSQDSLGMSRKNAVLLHGVLLWFLSLPCCLGSNVLADIHPLGGTSTILDLEDFITSSNILPLGGLLITLFCSLRCGWGFDAFQSEVNQGLGIRLPRSLRFYLRFVLPFLLLSVLVGGYLQRFL